MNKMWDNGLLDRLHFVLENDFKRLDYTEGIEILKASGRKFEFPCDWGCDLQSEHERYLVEEHFKRPVILINYPKDIKAFYMKPVPGNPERVLCADLLAPEGYGEIIGGSMREEDYDALVAKMESLGMDRTEYEFYLDLRKYGSVPHGGFGIGIERMVTFVAGTKHIREAIPFPRMLHRIKP